EQTDFNFSYHGKLNLDEKVLLEKEKIDLESLLMEISRQSNVQFKQINYTIAVSMIEKEELPEVTVQGKITDSNGLPLPGATIIEVGTTNGAISDLDGNYSIVVEKDAS